MNHLKQFLAIPFALLAIAIGLCFSIAMFGLLWAVGRWCHLITAEAWVRLSDSIF